MKQGDRVIVSDAGRAAGFYLHPKYQNRVGTVMRFGKNNYPYIKWDGNKVTDACTTHPKFLEKEETQHAHV